MPFNRNTHNTVKTREGTMPGAITPHLVLVSPEGQMIIQDGEWYTAGGDPVEEDDVPDWAWEIAKTLSPDTRDSLNMEPLPASALKKPSSRPSIDVDAQSQGNPPMQLGEGAYEKDGKATPVPQGNDADTAPAPKSQPVQQAQPAKAPIGKK